MRKATNNDKYFIINLLTQSFNENKSVNYVVKQDKKRVSRIRVLMNYSFYMCQAFGEVWISDNEQACALVLYPDKKHFSLRSIFWDIKLIFSTIGIERLYMVLKREALIKKSYPIEKLAYLWFVGVVPISQGRGVGSSFMQEVTAFYRLKNRPIYLETSMERNLPFYNRMGFEMVRTFDLGYTLYQLRRI
jgi:GNAT superfamily N-acetyltransferase